MEIFPSCNVLILFKLFSVRWFFQIAAEALENSDESLRTLQIADWEPLDYTFTFTICNFYAHKRRQKLL